MRFIIIITIPVRYFINYFIIIYYKVPDEICDRLLKQPLAINPSAIAQKSKTKLKARWEREWRSSKRGQAALKIDSQTPSIHFLRAISAANIMCRLASLITQLRISHVPLNKHLARIKKVDSSRCPSCGINSKTVEHFLLNCPGYVHERWILEKRLRKKKKDMTMENLLGSKDIAVLLAVYIEATKRFDTRP